MFSYRSRRNELNVVILIGHIQCFMLNQLTSHHFLEVTTVLRQEHVDEALHVVGSASQYRAVNLPDLIRNVLF